MTTTKNRVFRLDDATMAKAEAVALHDARRVATGRVRVNRTAGLRAGIDEAYERRREALQADAAAWAYLCALAASESAMLTLEGTGVGDPTPEERPTPFGPVSTKVPPMWAHLDVAADLDGKPAELPLLVDIEPTSSTARVLLTDADGLAAVYLGSLSRFVAEQPARFTNRLHHIARDLHLA